MRIKSLGWLVLACCLVGAALWYHRYSVESSQPHYEARSVTRGPLDEAVLTTGTLEPLHTVAIGTQVSGQVRKMYVDYNSIVHKGQMLATIDTSTYEEARKQAQDDLDSANASLANARDSLANTLSSLRGAAIGVETAQAGVDSARVAITTAHAGYASALAGLNKAKASLVNDQLTYKRNQDLRRADYIAQSDLDTARTTYLLDVAGLQSAQAQVAQAQAGIDSAVVGLKSAQTGLIAGVEKRRQADIAVQEARTQIDIQVSNVKRAESSLRTAIINLGYCVIRSPVDGVVVSRAADPGQTVAAQYSTPTLCTIATDLHKMQVLASVDESDMASVFPNQTATFTVDAYPDDTFNGRVRQVRNASTVTNNVVTYQVLVDVDNPELKLRPAMTANLSLLVKHRDDVLLIPNMALRWEPDAGDPNAVTTPPKPTPTPTPVAADSGSPGPQPSGSPGWHHHHHRRDGQAGGDSAWGGGRGGPGGGHGGGRDRQRGADSGQQHRRQPDADDDDASQKTSRKQVPEDDDDEMQRQRIWVLRGTQAVATMVTTGITDGSKTEVISGLQEGDQVVVASLLGSPNENGHAPVGGGRGGRRMF